jgi:hypothetical protein
MNGRARITLGFGVVLIALGAFIAVRPLWTRVPITGTPLLDGAFALVFLVRGMMNVRRARRPQTR